MKMSIGEKKILFVFGCPNREATVDRLYQVADLIPDPAGKKVVEALAVHPLAAAVQRGTQAES